MLPVSARTLGDWLGITDRAVRMAAEEGRVVRSGHGKYDLKASVTRYASHFREVAANRSGDPENSLELTAERAALAREQREGQRIKNEAARRELVPVAEVEARWSDLVTTSRSRLLAVAARVRDLLPQLNATDIGKLDAEIRKALAEIGKAKSL
jgi:phage terminase Nu1 subunit (DNA packaging protein)